jgi:MGT family glycosyltransferase
MIYDPHVPPPALPWGYRRDAWGYLRNQAAKCLLVPVYEWLADARRLGVKPLTLVFDSSRGLAQIAQQPAFFDFPNASLPDHFHYTAPWHEAARDDDVDFPWDRLDDRPLVYASMGTLQNNQRRVFAAIAAALRDLPVQAVLTTGGATDGLELDLPANVVMVRNAPQLRLLDRAVLAITHAGLNTVLECLTRGVPMVCLPVTNDQPGVAKRVEWLGLGEMLPVRQATPDRIRALVERVSGDANYTERARQIRASLPKVPGVMTAADIVDMAFGRGQRVLADTSGLILESRPSPRKARRRRR